MDEELTIGAEVTASSFLCAYIVSIIVNPVFLCKNVIFIFLFYRLSLDKTR